RGPCVRRLAATSRRVEPPSPKTVRRRTGLVNRSSAFTPSRAHVSGQRLESFWDIGCPPGGCRPEEEKEQAERLRSLAGPAARNVMSRKTVMPARSSATLGSAGAFVTGIRLGCSLDLAWPGLTAPPVPAHPIGRSVEHPGSGIVQTPEGTRGTSG